MDINKARNYALRLLELRGRSIKDVRDKLKAKSASPQDIDLVIDDLLSLGLLDDEKFARDWIESRRHFRPTGAVRLRQELFAKGIDREIVDRAIREYKNDSDEFPAALDLARRKMKLYRKLDPDTAKRRLSGFLSRRGYEIEVVKKVLKKCTATEISQ